MTKLRICLLGVTVIMLVFLAFAFARFRQVKKSPETALALLPENADICLNEVSQVSTREGVKEWSLQCETANYNKKEGRSTLRGVSVTFFLKSGKSVQVTGDEGVILTDTKDMEITGNVIVQTDHYRLSTEKLSYDGEQRVVSTDMPVALAGDGVSLFGKNMTFSFAEEHVEVGGGVEAFLEAFAL